MVRRELNRLPIRFAEPIFYGLLTNEGDGVLEVEHSATVTLLELASQPRLITNWHVVEAIRRFIAAHDDPERIVVQVGNTPVDVLERLLDEDTRCDLAIVDATGLVLDRVPDGSEMFVQNGFHRPTKWPPGEVYKDDLIILGGYPELLRKNRKTGIVSSPFTMAGVPLTDPGYDEFRIKFDRDAWVAVFGEPHDPVFLTRELSGLSGSPVFVERERATSAQEASHQGIVVPELVGFVKAFNYEADMLVVTAASNIVSSTGVKHR